MNKQPTLVRWKRNVDNYHNYEHIDAGDFSDDKFFTPCKKCNFISKDETNANAFKTLRRKK